MIQSYLNGTSVKEVYYTTLYHFTKDMVKLQMVFNKQELCISPQDLSDVTLNEISPSITLLCSDVNLSSIIDV